MYKAKIIGIQGFEKLIAIKKILPHLVDEKEFVDCFIDEAKLAALLNHQNIVQIYDFGSLEGTYYIAMQYLKGKDLRMILHRTQEHGIEFGLEYCLYLVSRICSGLDYAHKLKDFQGKPLNLIHRDISPQNIFITYDGDIKIVDFGIAKAADRSSKTQAGMIKGKVAYMAPEQAAGGKIDYRSDIFSTGIILYELVTGQRMFTGDTMEILSKVREAAFIPAEDIITGLPEQLYTVLNIALSKYPEDRYESCADMLADLEECIYQLSKWPTSRGLATFMKSLFTAEIAEEEQPLQHTLDLTGDIDSSDSHEQTSETGVTVDFEVTADRTYSYPTKKKKKKLPMAIGGVALLIGLGLFAILTPFGDDLPGDSTVPTEQVAQDETKAPLESATEQAPETSLIDKSPEQKIPANDSAGSVAESPETENMTTEAANLIASRNATLMEQETAFFDFHRPQVYPDRHAFDIYIEDFRLTSPKKSHDPKPKKLEKDRRESSREALAALENKQYAEAVTLLKTTLQNDPSTLDEIRAPLVRALQERSQELLESDPQQAHAFLLQADQLKPEDARNHFLLGHYYALREDYEAAIHEYELVIELLPDFSDAYFNLGYLLAKIKDYERAEDMYEQTVRLEPPYLDEALCNLAIIQFFQGKKQKSRQNLKKALQINPKNALAQRYLKKLEDE